MWQHGLKTIHGNNKYKTLNNKNKNQRDTLNSSEVYEFIERFACLLSGNT